MSKALCCFLLSQQALVSLDGEHVITLDSTLAAACFSISPKREAGLRAQCGSV